MAWNIASEGPPQHAWLVVLATHLKVVVGETLLRTNVWLSGKLAVAASMMYSALADGAAAARPPRQSGRMHVVAGALHPHPRNEGNCAALISPLLGPALMHVAVDRGYPYEKRS